jgi:hypothetical protein
MAISFSQPAPFLEAAQLREIQTLLPTTLSSDELRRLSVDIRERSLFSARTYFAEYLQSIMDTLRSYEAGDLDQATAILEMKNALAETDYMPSAKAEGTIQDIGSVARRLLVLQMNADFAAGYGYFAQAQRHLEQWPAQELTRVGPRKTHRQWSGLDTGNIIKGEPADGRWLEAGGQLYDDRMIALVNDPIWSDISAFGLPYPPFDFNSGMGVAGVNRQDALKLGVIAPDDTPQAPVSRYLNQDLAVSADLRSDALRAALTTDTGYKFSGGILTP